MMLCQDNWNLPAVGQSLPVPVGARRARRVREQGTTRPDQDTQCGRSITHDDALKQRLPPVPSLNSVGGS